MHQALHSIYELNLKKSSLFASLKGKLFAYLSSGNYDQIIDDVWKEKISPGAIPAELFNATYNELNKQVDDAFGNTPYGNDNYNLANALRRDAAKFATYRNYAYLADLELKKIDTITGEVLSEADFKKVAKGLYYKYKNYAEAEKDLAYKTADMAVKWQDIERTKELYPNLEYRPSKAAEPREAHKQYYGLIKPIDDPIWESILPPNGWGCSCTVRKTRAEADGVTYEVAKPMPGIVGNAAKTGQLFSDNHSYYKNTPNAMKDIVNTQFESLYRKKVRVDAKDFAVDNFNGKEYYNASVNTKIKVNNTGIKEILNQTTDFYDDKNRLVFDLDELIKQAKKHLTVKFDKSKKGFDTFEFVHYLEFPLKEKSFYLVVRQTYKGELFLYSIVDKIKKG